MSEEMPSRFPRVGQFEKHLIVPAQILGCERTPFLVLVGGVAFLITIVFGITFPGLAAGVLIFLGGVRWLRAIFEQDPHYFAMRWMALRLPRNLPAEHPPEFVKDWAFVGYEDPPRPEAVFIAWLQVSGAAMVPTTLVLFVYSIPAAVITFAICMVIIVLWVFADDLRQLRRRNSRDK
ncbi:MAG: hypothetical protein OXC63_08325 [Aestuariivita sp.]|nr:hypothetical protein [Aestuariivita sp.]MCY4345397.1 hypothetical protein [Aestuariivita sp.]